ncbi:MAG TPA: LysE family transporter [Chryseolinea sp.]|nr:LysE family transporter [Chryseolinea sp.]
MVKVFFIGAIASFIGSIPPGTLNILVLQLGLENKLKAALHFALAVALVEYPYAWIAVEFEEWITSSPAIQENFKLLAASVMIILGILGIWTAQKPTKAAVKMQESGFVRGLILSILNPQAIPWWIGVTAYLKSEGFVVLDTQLRVHSYVLGTAIGALALLILLAVLAERLSHLVTHSKLLAMAPGVVLVILGILTLVNTYI